MSWCSYRGPKFCFLSLVTLASMDAISSSGIWRHIHTDKHTHNTPIKIKYISKNIKEAKNLNRQ